MRVALSILIVLDYVFRSLSDSSVGKYSAFQCIGGSQVFKTESLFQASIKVWPLNNPEFRTCLYRNVCFVNGSLSFYVRNNSATPLDFTPAGFGGKVNHLSYLRDFTVPVRTVIGEIPSNRFSKVNLTFLDANSWSFNYGHYINDNVIPTYYAARLFNLPFTDVQQVFETNCRLFHDLEEGFSARTVTYNHSMGTYRQACLEKLDKMYDHFYDHAPLYLDDMQHTTMCYKKLITGQGSAYGLKAIDLGKAVLLREFRDFTLSRIAIAAQTDKSLVMPPQENIILVGIRTAGAAGGEFIRNLCAVVEDALDTLARYKSKYTVKCIKPADLTFENEIQEVRRAKVIITVHGTISYMVYFSRDGTQQISIANPEELKENQNLLYATHFNTLYLTWDRMPYLIALLEHSLDMSEEYHYGHQ